MSKYLCDCRKCTNMYRRGDARWCKPAVDNQKSPLVVEGDAGSNFVFSCPEYTQDPGKIEPLPEKYPWK